MNSMNSQTMTHAPAVVRGRYKRRARLPRKSSYTLSFLRFLWNGFVRLFLKTYVRVSYEGIENLPKNQSYIIVGNHASHLDGLCLSAAVPMNNINHTHMVAAKDYFFSNFWSSLFSKIVMNAIPFDRTCDPLSSLSECVRAIVGDHKVLIFFPEGARSPKGDMQKFKAGIGKLVIESDTIVVPAYISGAYEIWPRHKALPAPGKVHVRFGKPVAFNEIEPTKEGFYQIAEQLEKRVMQLKDAS